MQLAHREIDTSLRNAVRHERHALKSLELAIRAQPRADGEELRARRLLQQGEHGGEEQDRGDGVDREVGDQVGLGDGGAGPVEGEDARVGDDDVEVGHRMGGLEGRDGRLGGFRVACVVGEDDELAAPGGGEGGEGLGRGVLGVADERDHGC